MSSGGQSTGRTRGFFSIEVVRWFRRQAHAIQRILRNDGPHERWCVDFGTRMQERGEAWQGIQ